MQVSVMGSNVKDYWTVTGAKTFTSARSGLLVSNDGASDITVAVSGMSFTLKPTEVLDEKFDPFTSVTITAGASTFRAWARG